MPAINNYKIEEKRVCTYSTILQLCEYRSSAGADKPSSHVLRQYAGNLWHSNRRPVVVNTDFTTIHEAISLKLFVVFIALPTELFRRCQLCTLSWCSSYINQDKSNEKRFLSSKTQCHFSLVLHYNSKDWKAAQANHTTRRLVNRSQLSSKAALITPITKRLQKGPPNPTRKRLSFTIMNTPRSFYSCQHKIRK